MYKQSPIFSLVTKKAILANFMQIYVDIYAMVGDVVMVGVSAVRKKSVGQTTIGQKM